MFHEQGLLIPRTSGVADWVDTIDATELMQDSVTWERVNAHALNYMNDDGAGSAVVLMFTVPVDDDNARVLAFPIDIGQVALIAMQLSGALASVYGKTLEQIIAEATDRIRGGDDLG